MAKIIGWIAFGLAIIGGAGLVGVGLTATVQIIVVFGALLLITMDVAKDKKPDQHAVIAGFALPALIVGIGGDFPEWLSDKLGDLWTWAEREMGTWVETSTVGFALFAVVISFLMSTRSGGTGKAKKAH